MYRLVLRGELGDQFGVLFEGMHLDRADGRTVMTGNIRDQAHLAGLIQRLQELGVDIISFAATEEID